VPYLFVEMNAVASGAARRIGGASEAVCLAFEKTLFTLPADCPSVVTGAPVSDAFHHATAEDPPCEGKQLLILNGAAPRGGEFNLAAHQAVCSLREHLQDWRIIHQTGDRQLELTERRYQQSGFDAIVVAHIDQMPSLLRSSDLVVCRSGGSMLAELTCVGAPAVLVPDPDSPSQAANAQAMAGLGAAVMTTQDSQQPLSEQLSGALTELLRDRLQRERMAQSARAAARPSAAGDIAQLCVDLLGVSPLRVAA
ncbi:MAG: hypothetical protein KDA37_07950, partial [Planctomycetales bacterium]|nr:hypothetical protein [Planctomycetales bacterium]